MLKKFDALYSGLPHGQQTFDDKDLKAWACENFRSPDTRAMLRNVAVNTLSAEPSPATHAFLTALKAGESVFQTRLLTKTVVHAYREAQPVFHALQNTV